MRLRKQHESVRSDSTVIVCVCVVDMCVIEGEASGKKEELEEKCATIQ